MKIPFEYPIQMLRLICNRCDIVSMPPLKFAPSRVGGGRIPPCKGTILYRRQGGLKVGIAAGRQASLRKPREAGMGWTRPARPADLPLYPISPIEKRWWPISAPESSAHPESASFGPWRRSRRLSVLGAAGLRLWAPSVEESIRWEVPLGVGGTPVGRAFLNTAVF